MSSRRLVRVLVSPQAILLSFGFPEGSKVVVGPGGTPPGAAMTFIVESPGLPEVPEDQPIPLANPVIAQDNTDKIGRPRLIDWGIL